MAKESRTCYMKQKILRYFISGIILVVGSTWGTLMARHFSLGPQRPSPDFRRLGPENARIEIQEFTDFACPACKHASESLDKIIVIYPKDIRLNFKHYPLGTIHPWSFEATKYADCAGRQGKFWEYAKLLFQEQEIWSKSAQKPQQFTEFAKRLNLDLNLLEICVQNPETSRQIRLDISEGDIRNINATPTFFINKKRAVGSIQLIEQVKLFDKIIKK